MRRRAPLIGDAFRSRADVVLETRFAMIANNPARPSTVRCPTIANAVASDGCIAASRQADPSASLRRAVVASAGHGLGASRRTAISFRRSTGTVKGGS